MLTTLTQATAAASKRQAPQTLAAQWEAHAAQHVSTTASAAEIRRQERAWYLRRLEELEAAPKTAENAALLGEAAGWARVSIGRAA